MTDNKTAKTRPDRSDQATNPITDDAEPSHVTDGTSVSVQPEGQAAPATDAEPSLELGGRSQVAHPPERKKPVPGDILTGEAPPDSGPVAAAPGGVPELPPPPAEGAPTATPAPRPSVPAFGLAGKRRSVLAVLVLSVITLGVYGLSWHSRINGEMRDFDPRLNVRPGRSLWAVAVPWLICVLASVAGFVRIGLDRSGVALPFNADVPVEFGYALAPAILLTSFLTYLLPFSAVAVAMTLERIRVVEDRVGVPTDVQIKPASVVAWLLLPVFGGLFVMGRAQSTLNLVWDAVSPHALVRPRQT